MPPAFDIRAVTLASALAWAKGQIHDSQLEPARQIVFWNELGDIASYRPALSEVARLKATGCRGMIVHACNPIVWRKLEREGCICSLRENIVWRDTTVAARRYIAPPAAFEKWLAKLQP